MTPATQRFIDIIGISRLMHGAWQSERGRGTSAAVLNGKESFILERSMKTVRLNPYPVGSDNYHAYQSGHEIERCDLADVVRRCKV